MVSYTTAGVKLNFSLDEDERLIEEVERHPALYDFKHASYNNQRIREDTWDVVAAAVGRSVIECKKRWKNIKDCNDRKLRESRLGGEAPPSKKTKRYRYWPLQDKLAFLNSVNAMRRSHNKGGDEEGDCGSDTLEETSINLEDIDNIVCLQQPSDSTLENSDDLPRIDLRNRLSQSRSEAEHSEIYERERESSREDDDLALFFKSICASVRKMPPAFQRRAKLQTLTLVTNLETELWAGKPTPTDGLHFMLPS